MKVDSLYYPLPQNLKAEESILGGILLDPSAIGRVRDYLKPEAFSWQSHAEIYRAAIKLDDLGQPTDLMSVGSWLKDKGLLNKAGGPEKLAYLVDCTVSAVNIDQYAELVLVKYQERLTVEAGNRIAELGRQTYSPIQSRLDAARAELDLIEQVAAGVEDQQLQASAIAEIIGYSSERLDVDEIFHPFLAKALKAAADSLPCPIEYLAQPLASIAAGLIGTKASIEIKGSWKEPCIVWTGTIGDAGSLKSPGLGVIKRPLVALQAAASQEYEEAIAEYEEAIAVYEGLDKSQKAQTSKPVKPSVRDFYMGRWTTEALLETHAQEKNGTGFVAIKDELAGLFTGMGQYKAGKGDDRQIFLDLWNGADDKVDRVGKKAFLPKTAISITGGIQEKTLLKIMNDPDDPDGMWGRFLWANPPSCPDYWVESETDISPFLTALYQKLNTLPPDITYRLTPDARRLYADWVDFLATEKIEATDALKNALSKLKGYTARLALLLHCLDRAVDPSLPESEAISAGTVRRAIAWSGYYIKQARLLHSKSQPDMPKELVAILNLSRATSDGWVSHRLLQLKKWAKSADEAKAKLQELARMGLGSLRREGRNLLWRFVEKCEPCEPTSQPPNPPDKPSVKDFVECEVEPAGEEYSLPELSENSENSTESFTVASVTESEDCEPTSQLSTDSTKQSRIRSGDRLIVKLDWQQYAGRVGVALAVWDSLDRQCLIKFDDDGSTWAQTVEAFEQL